MRRGEKEERQYMTRCKRSSEMVSSQMKLRAAFAVRAGGHHSWHQGRRRGESVAKATGSKLTTTTNERA